MARGGDRGGRRPKIADPRKNTSLPLNDAELAQYTAAASAAGLTRSAFVRMVVAEHIRNNGRRPISTLTLRKISGIRNALTAGEIEAAIVEFWRGMIINTTRRDKK